MNVESESGDAGVVTGNTLTQTNTAKSQPDLARLPDMIVVGIYSRKA